VTSPTSSPATSVAPTTATTRVPTATTAAPAATATTAGHPAGATARRNDNTYSTAATHQRACSHHGGVAEFYN
jgi:hypothetical protein